MSLPYIRIEYGESINSRKQILSSQMNILKLINKLNEYKRLRTSELSKKTRLKTIVRKSMLKVTTLINELPHPEGQKLIKHEKSIFKTAEKKKKASIESELAEIRNKLNAL